MTAFKQVVGKLQQGNRQEALIGLEFDSAAHRQSLLDDLPDRGEGFRSCQPVADDVHARLVGGPA